MHLYEDQKVFSASVNILNLKPLHSRILRQQKQEPRDKRGTGSKISMSD